MPFTYRSQRFRPQLSTLVGSRNLSYTFFWRKARLRQRGKHAYADVTTSVSADS